MNCMPCLSLAVARPKPLEEQDPEAREDHARNRRAAVLYLQAAADTEDLWRRNALRRRAAELVLPRKGTLRRRPIPSAARAR